ncbi:MAG: virulence protein RhuM/Fic/DOC family protein [Victivallaceae bacterium]
MREEINNNIEIYQTSDKQTQVEVKFKKDTVWLNQKQLTVLFDRERSVISKHINNIFKEKELDKDSVCAKIAHTAADGKIYSTQYYNLDVIISLGYRVKSKRGTQFRMWATQRLKDYLVQGYAINEKRLKEKQQEVEYLKTGIRILNRVIEDELNERNDTMLSLFAKGLELLDDYDHETLDQKGLSTTQTIYPAFNDYMDMIHEMYSDVKSDFFAKPKDDSFYSSINQIKQSFGKQELYPSLEEKAANLLYLITKNHSFVDGNKRIAAACFLFFLEQNNSLINNGKAIISNEALAALTLFIASSKAEEAEIVKRLTISILNRNQIS